MSSFHERLKLEREKKKKVDPTWTQEFVANKLGVARVTYTAYENGTKLPPLDIVNKIADIFKVKVDYLLCRTDDPYEEEKPKGKFFFFDIEGLNEEEIELMESTRKMLQERARKRAAEQKKKDTK